MILNAIRTTAILALLGAGLRADVTVTVTLDTSLLPSQPYDLYFDLIDGSGLGDGNNTVTLSNFVCASCPASPVSLTDTSFFQDSTNPVTFSNQLQFLLNFTTNVDAGGTPDSFEFQLLDANTSGAPPIATTDPIAGDDLLEIDIDGSSPTINLYGSADPNFPFSAPIVSPVPEPPGYGFLFAVTFTCAGWRWLARRRAKADSPAR